MVLKDYFVIIFYIIACISGLFFLRRKKEEKFEPTMSYELLWQIVDDAIRRVIKAKFDDYTLRNVLFPNDYNAEVIELSHKALDSIGYGVIKELEHYHPTSYINNYIQKDMQDFLMEFMKKNRPRFK